jgi:transposase-like protein
MQRCERELIAKQTMGSHSPALTFAGEESSRCLAAMDERLAEREMVRLRWPAGPVCPFCRSCCIGGLNVRGVRRRRFKCRHCRRQFSVTKGTILEGSKLPLAAWVRLVQMFCDCGGEVSVIEICRELDVGYDTVRNAVDRLSYAVRRKPLASVLVEGGIGESRFDGSGSGGR